MNASCSIAALVEISVDSTIFWYILTNLVNTAKIYTLKGKKFP